jgi:high-affinity iron transporter
MDRKSEGLCIFYERFVKNPSCILGPKVWDLSPVLPDDRFPGVLLNALFGYTQRLFLVQAIAYGLFILSIGTLYFRSLGIPLPFRSFKPGRC